MSGEIFQLYILIFLTWNSKKLFEFDQDELNFRQAKLVNWPNNIPNVDLELELFFFRKKM